MDQALSTTKKKQSNRKKVAIILNFSFRLSILRTSQIEKNDYGQQRIRKVFN